MVVVSSVEAVSIGPEGPVGGTTTVVVCGENTLVVSIGPEGPVGGTAHLFTSNWTIFATPACEMSSGEIDRLLHHCKSAHSDVRRGESHHGATEGRFTGVAGDCPCFLATGVQRSVARQVLGEADRNVCSTSKLSLAAPEDGPAGSVRSGQAVVALGEARRHRIWDWAPSGGLTNGQACVSRPAAVGVNPRIPSAVRPRER